MFNPFVDPVHGNPYPHYRHHREHQPVARGHMQTADHDFSWYVFRHEDVCHMLRSPEFGREGKRRSAPGLARPVAATSRVRALIGEMMLLRDPPHHTRLRQIVQDSFHPQALASSQAAVDEIVQDLMRPIDGGTAVDLIADFAMPVPIRIIARMVGIPEQYESRFGEWGLHLVRAMDAHHTPEIIARAEDSAEQIIALIDRVAQSCPAGDAKPGEPLIHLLERARRGGQLGRSELHAMVVLLLVAGHETTAAMIGNIAHTLLGHPAIANALREEPQWCNNAILEMARFDSSVQRIGRVALTDTALAGVPIAQGEHVYAILGSANRDERQFSDPDRIDIRRDLRSLRLFGNGVHFCLGSVLARMEFLTATRALLARSDCLRLDLSSPLSYRPSSTIRCLASLPVTAAQGSPRGQSSSTAIT